MASAGPDEAGQATVDAVTSPTKKQTATGIGVRTGGRPSKRRARPSKG